MIIAICPGSYDPIQNGHLDIIKRASMLADKVYVVIGVNPNKTSLFTKNEKIKMIKKVIKDLPNVSVDANDGLTVDYAKKVNASLIIKGYRNEEDYNYELSQIQINKNLAPEIDTLLLVSSNKYKNISSTLIKTMVKEGKDISSYIPKEILKIVTKKIKRAV